MSSKQYFDSVAPQWDTIRQSLFSEAVREKAIATAKVKPGKIAVDVGAGTGFVTEGLIHKGLKVISVDSSAEMLRQMQEKFRGADVDYRLGEAEKLPIDDASVDYVFANMCLHHVGNPLVAIKEMRRALKPGGKLVITDMDEHQFEFLRTEQHDRWLGFKREDVEQWFVEAGLKGVVVGAAGET
jgi:ubiquinone/menaquinone biosynthesis C-methylase UbiE